MLDGTQMLFGAGQNSKGELGIQNVLETDRFISIPTEKIEGYGISCKIAKIACGSSSTALLTSI
jgi:alpha-tubulin suppressor-like RCC1 family protein